MSAHPNRDAPLSSAEHWCGPLCPTTTRRPGAPLAGSTPMVAGDNSTTGAVKASPAGGPNGPALTALPTHTLDARALTARAHALEPDRADVEEIGLRLRRRLLTSSASSGTSFWRAGGLSAGGSVSCSSLSRARTLDRFCGRIPGV